MGVSRVWASVMIQCLLLCNVFPSFTSLHTPLRGRRKLATVSDIQSCLSPAGANVTFPGDPDFDTARGKVFNHRNLYTPAGIVFATSVAHVQNAVTCAVKLNIGISPRSGGHSFEDYALGGRDGVLVVDLGSFTQFSYNSSAQTAVVGAGFRLGPLKLALWNEGKVTIPSGSCPSVGVGGHSLGGGWGYVSRKFGIMSDNILEARVVINNGSLVIANHSQNCDLLQALKGAGANSYGIVTQFTFRVYDVSSPVTYFSYHFDDMFQPLKAFQIWGVAAPMDVTASVYYNPSSGSDFSGLYLGTEDNLRSQLQTFLDNSPTPTSNYTVQTDYIHSVLIQSGTFDITDDPSVLNLQEGFVHAEQRFKSKDLLVKGSGISDHGITAYVNHLQALVPTIKDRKVWYVGFNLIGGENSIVNSFPVNPGDGWVHRDSLYEIQIIAFWDNDLFAAASDTNFVESIWRNLRPHASSEGYQNNIDVEMPLSAYYGKNLESLIATKLKWDSANIFNFNQSIPVSFSDIRH